MTCRRKQKPLVDRPPRPLPFGARRQVFLEEVIADALRDGLAVQCDTLCEEGPVYALTPEGEAWLRDFPDEMLACYPEHRRGRA